MSHLRLQKVRDAMCRIVSSCSDKGKATVLNLCFASATSYETELTGQPIYAIGFDTVAFKCPNFRAVLL